VTLHTSLRAYLLVTQDAIEVLGPIRTSGIAHDERYPDAGSVLSTVIPLNKAGVEMRTQEAPTV
jgi:hypothetical protein